ncbi:hypothetical protein MPTK1_4g18720 [Marchantia polymorpha subsp. ruderalis]|uniref:Uncharacterized protein n=2 Tax=Marchantia polymorpha TaxID=3197 RepID=A0AAF6BBC8_MARPO|nr:hypothetical protein MARPO_0041s0154 [Marchantia polymorpha]BBN09312.1 hypothetical protein Mp_4g18720 [Marchantia polymorpha subsp. ruderalis]|eukprot:PTQ40303.1 hypothetical protein MARPO_0041s0154 [Marchantia polymorpha]
MMECVVVGLVVDRSTKHFKLLLGGVLLPDERRTLIYDSMIGTWSWLSHPFPAESKVRWKVGRSVACGGRLYWLLWKCTSLGMYLRKALVIFDLREEKWKAFVEKVNKHEAFLEKVEDIPYDADESQKRLRAIDAYPLANWWLHRHKYSAAFLSHPKVRAMDGALVGPRKWDGKEGRPFLDCAAGVSDAIFVDEEFDDPVVAKYWARFDMLVYVPLLNEAEYSSFWSILPQDVYDPLCAMIPTPGVSARNEWIAQPRREPQEVVEVPIGEELHEGPGNEDAVDLRSLVKNDISAMMLVL